MTVKLNGLYLVILSKEDGSTMDQHLYTTMLTESVDMTVRKRCAAGLLASPNSRFRSAGYWFKERGYLPLNFAVKGGPPVGGHNANYHT